MRVVTQEEGEQVCAALSAGKSLRAACVEVGRIAACDVLERVKNDPEFGKQYARAREAGYQLLADEIVEIADEEVTMIRRSKHQPSSDGEDDGEDDGEVEVVFDATAVQRNRLRVDTRKWMLSKMLPKVYGDKLTHAGDPENPLLGRPAQGMTTDELREAIKLLGAK
jgi:hypothetical protein